METPNTPAATTITRREALRRGAVVGGAAAWALPTVQTIGVRAAYAQTAGTPQPGDPGTGSVSGVVLNARTGDPISGATVQIAGQSAVTGSDGAFAFSGVPAGNQTLTGSHPDYSTASVPVTVPDGGGVVQNLVLSPLGVITLVLTWGASPSDLDLHASGPDGSGGRFHVAYYSLNPVSHASLDVDDTSSFGPETVTINVSSPGGDFVAGQYEFWVHNFSGQHSGDQSFAGSEARTVLTGRDAQVGEWLAADATGDPSQFIWRVVGFDLDTAGAISNVTVRQFFTSGDQTSIFP